MKVLIAGGGIAGPTAAIALAKAGISAEIFEALELGRLNEMSGSGR
jgi:2-polyprenyl-6-methoxyphenol hydroxylase-like FAD-dependent oxidoreductase